MIRPNFDRRIETARLGRAALDGKGGPARAADPKGTTLLQCGVVPHPLVMERDGQSVWASAKGTRPLGDGPGRTRPLGQESGQPTRTEPLPLGRLLKWLLAG